MPISMEGAKLVYYALSENPRPFSFCLFAAFFEQVLKRRKLKKESNFELLELVCFC